MGIVGIGYYFFRRPINVHRASVCSAVIVLFYRRVVLPVFLWSSWIISLSPFGLLLPSLTNLDLPAALLPCLKFGSHHPPLPICLSSLPAAPANLSFPYDPTDSPYVTLEQLLPVLQREIKRVVDTRVKTGLAQQALLFSEGLARVLAKQGVVGGAGVATGSGKRGDKG